MPDTPPPPSFDGLHSSWSRGGGVEEETEGDRKQDKATSTEGDGGKEGRSGGGSEQEVGRELEQSGAGDGAEAEDGEGKREREDSGESSPRETCPRSTSRTHDAVVWEAINPADGDANGGSTGFGSTPPPSTPSQAAVAQRRRRRQNKFQPSTFKELMTGLKDEPLPEVSMGRSWNSPAQSDYGDDDAESTYGGSDGRSDDGVMTDSDMVINQIHRNSAMTAATRAESIRNIRKLAEAESIWESGSALARKGNDGDAGVGVGAGGRRVVSGRYRRVDGQVRSRTVQPEPQPRGRMEGPIEEGPSESAQQQNDKTKRSRSVQPESKGRTSRRGGDRPKPVRQQRRQQEQQQQQKQKAIGGGGGGVLTPTSESPTTAAVGVAVPPNGEGKGYKYKSLGGAIRGPAPGNRRSIGKKISSMFGRKSF